MGTGVSDFVCKFMVVRLSRSVCVAMALTSRGLHVFGTEKEGDGRKSRVESVRGIYNALRC